MGKTQKKRAMRRHNPVRVPDSHLQQGLATAAASTPSVKRDAVLPVIEKLGSTVVQERIWACAAVSNLIQNDSGTRRLLQGKNVVGALIARLGDESEEVIVEAAGALRNLCIDGGYEICAEMFNKGILQPLSTFVPKISSALSLLFSAATPEVEKTRLVCTLAENTITLFWCLAETSNKALNAVNQLRLVPFLVAFLDRQAREKLPLTAQIAAAQCLYVLTEENSTAVDEIRMDSGSVNSLLGIAKGDAKTSTKSTSKNFEGTQRALSVRLVSLRTLVCGILRNIMPLPVMMPASAIDIDRTIVLPFLLPLLSLDLATSVTTVQSLLLTQENEAIAKQVPVLKNGAKSDHKSTADVELEWIETEMRAVKLALELITAICAELPEPEDEEDEEIEEDEEDEEDEEIEEDEEDEEEEWEDDEDDEAEPMEEDRMMEDAPTVVTNGHTPTAKSVDLVSSIVPACLAFIKPTPLSYPPPFQPSPHPPTTSALIAIHIAALECLNNLCLSIAELGSSPITPTASSQHIASIWTTVWDMLATIGVPDESIVTSVMATQHQLWRIAVGVLWSVARIRRGDPLLVPDEEKVRVLMAVSQGLGAKDEGVAVACVGVLECLAVNPDPQSVETNKVIAQFILSLLPASGSSAVTQPEVVIQSASAMIDMFSDETSPWDINFRSGKWETVLKGRIEGVRRTVKAVDKRKEGGKELRRRGDDVLENLVAFVKYRRGLKL